jgi:hypothetical protein
MRVLYKAGSRQSFAEMDWEAQDAVRRALALVENKTGFRTLANEVWRDCMLVITMGHNIYTTSIEIRPSEQEVRRRPNAFNAAALYANGAFWAYVSRNKVELI